MDNMAKDIAEIKRCMRISYVKNDTKADKAKPGKLSVLTDAAVSEEATYNVPIHKVHMGDGKFFIKKAKIAKAERKQGLRPRLKALLTYMYQADHCHWRLISEGSKQKPIDRMHEIPDRHVEALIVVLQTFKWTKKVNLELSHVSREISKAISELKADKYPMSEDSSEDEEDKDCKKSEDPVDENKEDPVDDKKEVICDDKKDTCTVDLEKSFHESDMDSRNLRE